MTNVAGAATGSTFVIAAASRWSLRLAGLLVACVALAAVPSHGAAQSSPKKKAAAKVAKPKAPAGKRKPDERRPAPVDPQAEQAQQNAERARLTERLEQLKKQIAEGEKSRAGTATALARAERELADVGRRLDQLNERQRQLDGRIATLDRQRAARESEIASRRSDLGRTGIEMAANAERDPVKLWLTGRDPNEPMMTGAYLGYLARAQAEDIAQLQGRVSEIQSQRRQADDESRNLAEQSESERHAREALLSDRLAQRDALAKLSLKLAEQRKSASALDADQRRLTRVVEELQRVIDRKAAEEAARREAAKKRAEEQAAQAARAARRNRRGPEAPAESDNRPAPVRPPEPEPEPPVAASGVFGRQKGALRSPARGAVIARFGAPRGDGGASWKGIFIRTDSGAEVRAVAAGRVVFADYLRGFGNLLIVDHGDQYLSIYGNNESLLKHAGDAVAANDVISLAGKSGGDEQTGLYFELRFRGRPFDPQGWLGPR